MSFCATTCGTTVFPYAQCKLQAASLNAFDADNGNAGTLQVDFCLRQGMKEGLSLWYGEYPRRKKLPMFTLDERKGGVAAGCYTKFFRPQSARCGNFAPTDPVDLPSVCKKNDFICADGRWTSLNPQCKFNYDSVPIWLTAEDCVPGSAASNVVENVVVRYHPAGCDCSPGGSCGDGQNCLLTSFINLLSNGADTFGTVNVCRSGG